MNTKPSITVEDGQITGTDYFDSEDCRRGQAWAVTTREGWHILSTNLGETTMPGFARPVAKPDEPAGWAWQLELNGKHILLPQRVWRPYCPQPPLRNKRVSITVFIYRGYRDPKEGKGHFAAVPVGFNLFTTQLTIGW